MAGLPQDAIAVQLQWQADACRMIGSELYAGLLERVAADVGELGPTWDVLRGHEEDPRFSVLGLRLLGAVNRLVLTGRERALAEAYASRDASQAWERLRDTLSRNAAELRDSLERPVQTNEVGRCAALLFGFLAVSAETRLPLRELEGQRPELPRSVEVASRRGCDAAPIDPTTPEGRLALLTFIWPDQSERIARMRAALEIAATEHVAVDHEPAAAWAQRMLAESVPGQATVIYHSIVSQYLSDGERDALFGGIAEAGARATADAPLAWLRMEPADDRANLDLTVWPGGEERRLARVGYHGTPVELEPTQAQ